MLEASSGHDEVSHSRIAPCLVLGSALVLFAQFVAIFRWDDAWIASLFGALSLALAYGAPPVAVRRNDPLQRRRILAAWGRRVPWLFAPWWILAVLVLLSFRSGLWTSPDGPPPGMREMQRLVSAHLCGYAASIAACGAVFARLWWRSPHFAGKTLLASLACLVLAATALSGFSVLVVITLSIT